MGLGSDFKYSVCPIQSSTIGIDEAGLVELALHPLMGGGTIRRPARVI